MPGGIAPRERESTAWRILDEIHDPCSVSFGCPLSLVEMGLVRSVADTDGRLQVTLQLTEPTCMFSFRIAEEVERRLMEDLGDPVDVRLTTDPENLWSEDLIEPSARERLAGARRRRQLAAPAVIVEAPINREGAS